MKSIGFYVLKRRYAGGPVPLIQVRRFHHLLSIFNKKHPLTQTSKSFVKKGLYLRNITLADMYSSLELGDSSMTVETLDFIETYIKHLRPTLVLEFGSGISTVCIAQYMKELHGSENPPFVISIEEDARYAEATREMLAENNLSQCASVVHFPVTRQEIAGMETSCYRFPTDFEKTVLNHRKPELVIIDGPSGGGNVRFGTLPLVKNWVAPSATFILDDALRDWELTVSGYWKNIDNVQILGICLVGKGLLLGKIN